jgi:hypothetical protein
MVMNPQKQTPDDKDKELTPKANMKSPDFVTPPTSGVRNPDQDGNHAKPNTIPDLLKTSIDSPKASWKEVIVIIVVALIIGGIGGGILGIIHNLREHGVPFINNTTHSTTIKAESTAEIVIWAGSPYTDPKGYFKITPPKGWNIQNYPSEPRGKVAFSTTEGNQLVEIRVLVQVTQVTDFQVFESKLKANTANLGFEPEWQIMNFSGLQAIKSIMTLSNSGVMMKYMNIRFLDGNIYHDIQFASPPALFNKYQDLVSKVLATYEIVK